MPSEVLVYDFTDQGLRPAVIQYTTEPHLLEEGCLVDGVQERKRERMGAGTKYPLKDTQLMTYDLQLSYLLQGPLLSNTTASS